jgi:hypothetical protein
MSLTTPTVGTASRDEPEIEIAAVGLTIEEFEEVVRTREEFKDQVHEEANADHG